MWFFPYDQNYVRFINQYVHVQFDHSVSVDSSIILVISQGILENPIMYRQSYQYVHSESF